MRRSKVNQPSNGSAKRSKWSYALALLWLAACGGVVGKPHVGGESHFLRHCGDGCGPGLECVADICTRSCRVDASDCADLAASATCTNASIEPGAIAVCDLACQTTATCRELGSDFTCESGFCRGPIPTEPGPGGGGSASTGGSASGGSAVTVGGTESGGTPAVGGSGLGVGGSGLGVGGSGLGVQVPAARCLLPFASGPCDAIFNVYTFDGGQCVPAVYGGCEGNDNRFDTFEQCLNACEGRPAVSSCPDGRVAQEMCVACAPNGGCGQRETLCAQPCDALEPQCERGLTCDSGFCQVGRCI